MYLSDSVSGTPSFRTKLAYPYSSIPPYTPSSTITASEAILWISGIFDNSVNATVMFQAANDIARSGFTTVIFDFLHFHNDSTYYYNNIPVQNAVHLPRVFAILKNSSFSFVRTLLFSIGGAGVNDFDNIHQHWDNFSVTFPTLLQSFGKDELTDRYYIDGYDLDMEGSNWYPRTMTDIVLLGYTHSFYVTATPPDSSPDNFWLELINSTMVIPNPYASSLANYSALQRLQLQLYTNFPVPPSERIKEWTVALTPYLGISGQLQGYLAPGFEVSTVLPNQTVGWIEPLLPVSLPAHSVKGIFVYDYSQLIVPYPRPNISARLYAQAIFKGLN